MELGLRHKYNDSQSRDDNGRFSSGGDNASNAPPEAEAGKQHGKELEATVHEKLRNADYTPAEAQGMSAEEHAESLRSYGDMEEYSVNELKPHVQAWLDKNKPASPKWPVENRVDPSQRGGTSNRRRANHSPF